MRNLELEAFLDFATLSLRWLVLASLSAAFLNGEGGNSAGAATLLAVAVWNAGLTFLLFSSRRFDSPGTIRLAADLLIANLFVFFSSASLSTTLLAGMFPVMTAAMLFEWRLTLLTILASLVSLGIQIVAFSESARPIVSISWLALGLVAGGLAVQYFRRILIGRFEKIRRDHLTTKQELEKRAEKRTRTLVNAGEALSKDLDGDRIIKTALNLCANILSLSPEPESQPSGAALLSSESEPGTISLQVASSLRFSAAEEPVRFASTGGLITRSLEEGQPRLSKEVSKDPELYRFPALRAYQAAYCIPLAGYADPHPFGVLLLAHPDEDIFTEERRDSLDVIGRMAGNAIQNARRYRNLGLEKARLIEILQENRSRLVRELHDGSTQSVSALALRANLIRRTFERDGKIPVEELQKLEDLARTTAKEIRQMLFTLRPLETKALNLDASLEDLAENLRKTQDRSVVITADPEIIARLEPMKQAVIFYVAEEAIEIARRNGNTESVLVRLREEEGELACLEVEYPGNHGIAPDFSASYESRNSLSVSNMRERAALVNGYLGIEASDNPEVKIRLLVPVSNDAAERLRGRK